MDTINLDLSPFDLDYATFLQSCIHVDSIDDVFSDSPILQSSTSFQSSLSADLVQINLFPDSPMLRDDELLTLTASDIHPAHQALHALDLHLHQTQSSRSQFYATQLMDATHDLCRHMDGGAQASTTDHLEYLFHYQSLRDTSATLKVADNTPHYPVGLGFLRVTADTDIGYNLKQSLTTVTTKFSLHPAIFTAFWLGLLTTRNATPYPIISHELPPPLRATVTAQSRIGWDQLYHGHVSHLWERAIEQLNPQLKVSGRYIMIQMLKTIWTYILATWTMRNHHLHQDGGRLSLPNYQQAVHTIYDLKPQLPPAVQEALFQRSLDKMLEQPPAFLRLWIERSQRYIKQQLKAAQ